MANFNVKVEAYGNEVVVAVEAETSVEAIEKVQNGDYHLDLAPLTEGHAQPENEDGSPAGHQLTISIVE